MKVVTLATSAALLAGCAAAPINWRAEIVPVLLAPAEIAKQPKAERCRPMDSKIFAEAKDATVIAAQRGNIDALAAALMVSETRKNARLNEALRAYETCRRAHDR